MAVSRCLALSLNSLSAALQFVRRGLAQGLGVGAGHYNRGKASQGLTGEVALVRGYAHIGISEQLRKLCRPAKR